MGSLSESNYEVNVGVLETAHSIFRPWRAEARSDTLFTEINYVLSRFTTPFLTLFLHTTTLLFAQPPPPNLAHVAQATVFLVDLFYDLTCQDLPPGIEDSHAQFFGAQDGLFLRLLLWDPPQLQGDVSAIVCYLVDTYCTKSLYSLMTRRRRSLHKSRRGFSRSSRYVLPLMTLVRF